MNLKIIKYSLSRIGVCACVRACVQTSYLYACMYIVTGLYTDYTNIFLEIQGFTPLQMWFLFGNNIRHFPSRRRNYLPPAHFVGDLRKLSVACIKDKTVCTAHYPRARKSSEKLQCAYQSAECLPFNTVLIVTLTVFITFVLTL